MTNIHSQSFFGQSTGLTIQSISKEQPFIFFKCIKKKADKSWEKPSKGEGKIIKCNLEEIIMIQQVLSQKIKLWSTYHVFNKIKTQISFKWEQGNNKKLWINIGSYSKMLNLAQIEIFRLLLKHIIKEKIKYATGSSITLSTAKLPNSNIPEIYPRESPATQNNNHQKRVKINSKYPISGAIRKETDYALLIKFSDGKEIWTPKSVIKSEYASDKNYLQNFLIDTWFLRKINLSEV